MNRGPADALELLTLVAGGQGFGLALRQVREIRRWTAVTPIPHAPPALCGVINLRGAVVPILDLADRLGLGATVPGPRSVFVVAEEAGRVAGLLVESVSEILAVPRASLREIPAGAGLAGGASGVALAGLVETESGLVRLLDLASVLPPVAARAA